jgi:hypothetical protein
MVDALPRSVDLKRAGLAFDAPHDGPKPPIVAGFTFATIMPPLPDAAVSKLR